MIGIETFPSGDKLKEFSQSAPAFMRPCEIPYAVSLPGYLTDSQCDEIQTTLDDIDAYVVKGCGAVTREVVAAPCLDPIEQAARNLNRLYWNYDLDPGQHSWLQTYGAKGKYQRHADGSPGQMRKLTAVAMLSEPDAYRGGDLWVYVDPKVYRVPRVRGTVVVFQPWIEHEVATVTGGVRQTINMGFWGPPFR